MTPALARPWAALWHQRVAQRSGRDDARARPATRLLLFGLGGWAAGAFALAAVVLLWPSTPAVPERFASPGPSPNQDYGAITERPLFVKTRRPTAMPVFVPPVAPPRDHAIVLKGVFVNGSQTQAFLTSGAEPQGRWLGVNGVIAGWTIESLTPDEVRLEADGETLTVSIHPGPSAAPSSPRGTAMPTLPGGGPFSNRMSSPINAAGIEPGLRPEIQEMTSAPLPGLLGMGPRPGAKRP